jgi:hypothetical protein
MKREREMKAKETAHYPPLIAELLQQMPLAPLGPGKPVREARSKLEAVASAFPAGADRDMAAACRAGLWLAFNFLDEAHTISQELEKVEGSYWHALMHRREPDFGNSKYWFRRVGRHPVFESLRTMVEEMARTAAPDTASLLQQENWDPFAFVDLCEANYEENAPGHEWCRQVQREEWLLLFAYCFEKAAG